MKARQHWRQNSHKPLLCSWHWRLRRGRGTGIFTWASWRSLHSLRHRDLCREGQADDKQHQWHQHRDQSEWTVTSFKYLGSVITDEGSKPETFSRIAQTTAALIRLKPVWNDRSISLSSKIRLMRCLVTSIFLYTCESWTLTTELKKYIYKKKIKKEYKPWNWGATARYYISHRKTLLATRKSVPRFSRQLDHTKTSWRP